MHEALTLEQVRTLTGHEQRDAVRMALRRAGVKATGASLVSDDGKESWPPRKLYAVHAVWHVFGSRIIENAASDPSVRDLCWEVFGRLIRTTVPAEFVRTIFAERLDG